MLIKFILKRIETFQTYIGLIHVLLSNCWTFYYSDCYIAIFFSKFNLDHILDLVFYSFTILSDSFQRPRLKSDFKMSPAVILSANKINKKIDLNADLGNMRRHSAKCNSSRGSFFVPGRLFQSIERSGRIAAGPTVIAPNYSRRATRCDGIVVFSQVQD